MGKFELTLRTSKNSGTIHKPKPEEKIKGRGSLIMPTSASSWPLRMRVQQLSSKAVWEKYAADNQLKQPNGRYVHSTYKNLTNESCGRLELLLTT